MKVSSVSGVCYPKPANLVKVRLKEDSQVEKPVENIAFKANYDRVATAGTSIISGIVGGVIGFIVGGPPGAVIGAGLGAGAGAGAQEMENDSMNNGDYTPLFDPSDERGRI